MRKNSIKLFKDEEGATALEYGLMAAAVAGTLIMIAYFLGGRGSSRTMNNVAQHIYVVPRSVLRARASPMNPPIPFLMSARSGSALGDRLLI